MEGLEVSVLSKKDIDLGNRIDAEYFQQCNLLIEQRLKELPHKTLGEIATFVASAFYPAATQLYAIGDTPFIRCVDCINYPLITKGQDESFEKIPINFILDNSGVNTLNKGDIVITKVGSPCYASIVYEHDTVALSRTVMGIKNISTVIPLYLLAFLRCKYGFQELYREREQTIQFQLTLERVRNIPIYIASSLLQDAIANVYHRYYVNTHNADQIYEQAENILFNELCFNKTSMTPGICSYKRFSDFFDSGRLDAEYYHSKYDEIIDKIAQYPYGYDKIGKLYILRDKNFLPDDNTRYKYIELSDIGINGEISGCTYEYGSNLPSRARRIVHTGDIIISSIEGSLQSCAIITEEYDGALCSTGFYVLSPRRINSETSLVLFKSPAIQALLKRACTGTILTAMNKDEFTTISLPIINIDTQNKITDIVQQSTALRKESHRLLNLTKAAVEVAIEQGETAAMEFIAKNK